MNNLDSKKVLELKEISIKGYSKLNKVDLIIHFILKNIK
jgi:hypothetical protein